MGIPGPSGLPVGGKVSLPGAWLPQGSSLHPPLSLDWAGLPPPASSQHLTSMTDQILACSPHSLVDSTPGALKLPGTLLNGSVLQKGPLRCREVQ